MNTTLNTYHENNRYFNIFYGAKALNDKRLHIENVVRFAQKIYETYPKKFKSSIDNELLSLCAEHHDDGRVNQYELLGKFWDTEVSHNVLGLERFDKWLNNSPAIKVICGGFILPLSQKETDEIKIFRDVMLYHGRQHLCFNQQSLPYIELITAADDLENAAACVSYLIREVETDAKGYRQTNPEVDQRSVSDFVFHHFTAGEKFDKLKYCNTYAEYVLFAATLMTSCINKYSFAKELLLQPGYGYPSILAGYQDVFEKTLSPETAKASYNILCEYASK